MSTEQREGVLRDGGSVPAACVRHGHVTGDQFGNSRHCFDARAIRMDPAQARPGRQKRLAIDPANVGIGALDLINLRRRLRRQRELHLGMRCLPLCQNLFARVDAYDDFHRSLPLGGRKSKVEGRKSSGQRIGLPENAGWENAAASSGETFDLRLLTFDPVR